MYTGPYICVPMVLPAHLRQQANLRTIQENQANLPAPGSGTYELAVASKKLWENGRTLRINFIGGDPVVQQRVIETASEWTQHANLHFEFGDHPEAEIRIAFAPGGSWSYIGTDALPISPTEPTVNFGWLTPDLTQDKYSAVVLHEFGHTIGCIHEHQTPIAGIQWNKPVVYDWCWQTQGWNKAIVDHNIFDTYAEDSTNFSAFDPTSIMVYAIPKEWTLNGYEVLWTTQLSATDKTFIAQVYP